MFVALLLSACSLVRAPADASDPPEEAALNFEIDESLDGVRLDLSERPPDVVAPAPQATIAEHKTLSNRATAALFSDVSAIEPAADAPPFAQREAAPLPPRTGSTRAMTFPPDVDEPRPATLTGALNVVRFAPEGEVPLAPHLSITFDQPMVALSSQDEAARTRPVSIVPEPPGQWRWVGTRTLLFEPEPRFPMATEYAVEVAEAISVNGATLTAPPSWTFATPPLTLVEAYPKGGPHGLEPFVVVVFDQTVPSDLADRIVLRDVTETVSLVPAPAAEASEVPKIRRLMARYEPSRYAVFRPSQRLEPGRDYVVVVPEGTPSGEGPRLTTEDQTWTFRTFDPLILESTFGDRGEATCTPNCRVRLSTNNPLDPAAFDATQVSVEPPMAGLRASIERGELFVWGDLKPQTTYTVTLRGLTDVFGQTADPIVTRFQVGRYSAQLLGPDEGVVVLDPAGPAAVSAFAVNIEKLRLRAFRVTPDDLPAVSKWARAFRRERTSSPPPVERLETQTIANPDFAEDEVVETRIDLTPWLGPDGFGHVLLVFESRRHEVRHVTWVQRTALGITAVVDHDEIRAWTTALDAGTPLAGVEVSRIGQPGAATTDADGIATLPTYPSHEGPHALVARRGTDVALLPEQRGWWGDRGSWSMRPPGNAIRWFVFDDRTLYKPGETLSVKGWLRRFDATAGGGVAGVAKLPRTLDFDVGDARGQALAEPGTIDVSDSGAFDLTLVLPTTANLGPATLTLRGDGDVYRHRFQIREFRRPKFEVTTEMPAGPHILGQQTRATVDARYFASGPLPNAPVEWTVTTDQAVFAPPGWSDYHFGPTATETWGMWGRAAGPRSDASSQTFEGTTDANGQHRLEVGFVAVNPPRPYTVKAAAVITDVDRRRWTDTQSVLMHPSRDYVGVRTDRGFYERDQPIQLEVVVADLEGEVRPGRAVDVVWTRLERHRQGGKIGQTEGPATSVSLTSGRAPVTHRFTPPEGGRYRVRARTVDDEGRPNETEIEVWVRGGTRPQAPDGRVRVEDVTLIGDRASWQPGQTARVLVEAPFAPAEGLLTIGRNGVISTRHFTMPTASTTVEIPIDAQSVPNLWATVDLVGRRGDDGTPDPPRRVAVAHGSIELPVPPVTQTLTATIAPRQDPLGPGGSTRLDLDVRDATGAPVAAEVAVVVVDEAVLALADRATPDPLAVFYGPGEAGFRSDHTRPLVLLEDSETPPRGVEGGVLGGVVGGVVGGLVETRGGSFSIGNEGQSSATGPTLRQNFAPNALFAPHVTTAANGTATVELTVPDSLTRYRILAVAVAGDRFGVGESSITARRSLMVRPSPPRFLNFGDRAELPLVVQNLTDRPMRVKLGLRMTNATVIDPEPSAEGAPQSAGRRFTVPASDRREVRIPIAVDRAGTARFQAVVRGRGHVDAAAFAFPVWTPATHEAFATYGEIDDGTVVQPIVPPPETWPQFGGLEITTSSTALAALTDALLYLTAYPYDCTEQIASRVLAVVALNDVLDAFDAEGLPAPQALRTSVLADLERLAERQRGNGGFGFWPQMDDDPFLSIHVAHALVRARDQGLGNGNGNAVRRALGYAKRIERHIPDDYPASSRRRIQAYALYVLHLAGTDQADRARALLADAGLDGLPLEAQGWIAPVLHAGGGNRDVAKVLRHWANRITETAGGAQFDVAAEDHATTVLLHSARRTDAVLLDSLVRIAPDHDIIPKLVRGLLGHRQAGRWATTQENSFVLLAMNAYFRAFESPTPDFVARVWLGDQYAGEQAFHGRTTDRFDVDVPMAWLGEPADLVLAKEGPGRLYYRLGLRYAPKTLDLAPADRGFALQRTYEPIEDPTDVTRDDNGTWRIRAGARVRVRITMVSDARRTHVALTDPLPGGLEALEAALAPVGGIPDDIDRSGWWLRPWYEHRNLRDERAEAFTRRLPAGVFEFTYGTIATTPGRFVVPPARAEEMYHPETFGRTGSDQVVVE